VKVRKRVKLVVAVMMILLLVGLRTDDDEEEDDEGFSLSKISSFPLYTKEEIVVIRLSRFSSSLFPTNLPTNKLPSRTVVSSIKLQIAFWSIEPTSLFVEY